MWGELSRPFNRLGQADLLSGDVDRNRSPGDGTANDWSLLELDLELNRVSRNASNDLLELFLAKLIIQRVYRVRRAEDFSRKVLISQSDLTGHLCMHDGRHERTVFP